MAKKEILARFNFKDYNKELEQVLDGKDFQSQVKNLLLSMFYKLEIGYKDYMTVKKDSISKEAFLENIMYIIREKCDEVELIKPNEENQDEKKYYAYPEEKKIACYQNEASILHAILELGNKSFIIQNEDVIKNPLQLMLKEGYELDIKEVLTNFDGWAWNNNLDKTDKIDYFLIYELLRIIMGNSFMYDWKRDRRNDNNYLKEIRKKSRELYEAICKYCIAINPKGKKYTSAELKKIKEELASMENKTVFLKEKYEKKKELTDKLKLIDRIINNNELLKEEFISRNSKLPDESKIFSISDLEEIIETEKNDTIKQNEEVNEILKPKNYLKTIERLQEEIDLVEKSKYKTVNSEQLEKELISLQLIFIENMKKILSLTEDKKTLQDLIYKFRYYIYLPIKINNEIMEIKDIPEIKPELEKLEKKLITKACKQKALIIINQDIGYNAMIMKKIINTRLVELSSITAIFTKVDDNINISIFDGEVQDRIETVKKDKEKDFRIKFDKKIKLFM